MSQTGFDKIKTFDFNPYNLYQTPGTKWNAVALAKYKFTDHIEGYSHFIYEDSSSSSILAASSSPFALRPPGLIIRTRFRRFYFAPWWNACVATTKRRSLSCRAPASKAKTSGSRTACNRRPFTCSITRSTPSASWRFPMPC